MSSLKGNIWMGKIKNMERRTDRSFHAVKEEVLKEICLPHGAWRDRPGWLNTEAVIHTRVDEYDETRSWHKTDAIFEMTMTMTTTSSLFLVARNN